jgi:mannose-6-phosphate isomerase-like protein (cupin superfamily)
MNMRPADGPDGDPPPTVERTGEAAFDFVLHGGEGSTRIQWYFHDRSELPVALQAWELPPGGSEGRHAHPAENPLEDQYLIIAGQARMQIDGRVLDLGPGDAVLAPVGSEHDLRNTGDTVLHLVVVWGRPGHADFSEFATAQAARQARRNPSHPA